MPRFQFRLAALLKYREGLRDQCRQVLAHWLQQDALLVNEQARVAQERVQQLEEMRTEQIAGRVEVDKLSARRYRAGQLTNDLQQLAQSRRDLAIQIHLCRQALVKADQGVKVLEKLSDRQREEFEQQQAKSESRELEEIWMAGKIKETA